MPPPSSAPLAGATITLTLTIATSLEGFDSTAQSEFKANLAARLGGVSPNDITLQVSAASVRVVATIAAPSEAVANAALSELKQLATSTESLSVALGVTVEKVDSVPVLRSASDSQNAGVQSESVGGVAIGAIVGGTVLLGLLVAAFVLLRATKQRQTQEIEAASVEIEVASATSEVDVA